MSLLNEKLKLMSCTEFRVFLKKLIEDKIEKEWTPNYIDNITSNYAAMTITEDGNVCIGKNVTTNIDDGLGYRTQKEILLGNKN